MTVKKPRLYLIKGGKDDLRIGTLQVTVAPPEALPFVVDAIVIEEDTWLILSTAPEVSAPSEHPLRILTSLLSAEPELPGRVVVREGAPLILLAIVYDVGHELVCRTEWVEDAYVEIFGITGKRGIRSLSLPLLGIRHGRIPVARAVDLLVTAIGKGLSPQLERLWIMVPKELETEVMGIIRNVG